MSHRADRARAAALGAAIALAWLVAPSCRSPDEGRGEGPSAAAAGVDLDPREREPPRERAAAAPPLERIGRDLYIYRMQWQRADETVEVLRLLLESQTGREVVILPHEESNAILFRVLPPQPGEGPVRPLRTPSPRN